MLKKQTKPNVRTHWALSVFIWFSQINYCPPAAGGNVGKVGKVGNVACEVGGKVGNVGGNLLAPPLT